MHTPHVAAPKKTRLLLCVRLVTTKDQRRLMCEEVKSSKRTGPSFVPDTKSNDLKKKRKGGGKKSNTILPASCDELVTARLRVTPTTGAR